MIIKLIYYLIVWWGEGKYNNYNNILFLKTKD